MTASPNVTQAVPFFLVADMRASLEFYVDGLGFALKRKWTPDDPDNIRWCWLELGAAALMLQEVRPDAPHAPKGLRGLATSVCFMCADALAIYREALAKGLKPARPFVGNNLWVVHFDDPDGFKVDFESPTDVAEDTEYDPALHA